MKIKTLKLFAFVLLGSAVMFTSCGEDPETFDAPTVNFDEGTTKVLDVTDVNPYELSLNVTITAPGTIESVTLERSKLLADNLVGEVFAFQLDGYAGKTEATIAKSDNINHEQFFNGEIDEIEYMVVVTDKQGEISSATFTVTMGAFTKLENVQNGEIWKIQNADGNGSWNLKDDEPVSSVTGSDEDAAKRYMINATRESTLDTESNFDGSWGSDAVEWYRESINDYHTTNGNGIKYVKAESFNFDVAIKEVALKIFNDAGAEGQLTLVETPAVNDIYIGVLNEEIYVLKITEIDATAEPGAKANTGVMKFTYKK